MFREEFIQRDISVCLNQILPGRTDEQADFNRLRITESTCKRSDSSVWWLFFLDSKEKTAI